MNRFPARAVVVALVALLAIAIAGCGASAGSAGTTRSAGAAIQKVDAARAVGLLAGRVVIDVRTPAEYAAGHIAGARNIDVEAADFGSKIAQLDRQAPYLVYCHSGRRSGIAATELAKAGFTDIVDAGAMADLVTAGAPTE